MQITYDTYNICVHVCLYTYFYEYVYWYINTHIDICKEGWQENGSFFVNSSVLFCFVHV